METVGPALIFVHCNAGAHRICGARGRGIARDEAENYTYGVLSFIFLKPI
jgi:hypothetical protein